MSPSQLRRLLRLYRRALPAAQRKAAAQQLLQQFLSSPFLTYQHIAIYWAVDGEIDPSLIIRWLWQHQKACYLPVLDKKPSKLLRFASYHPTTLLKPNRFYIPEPTVQTFQLVPADKLDVILLPTVGFDRKGHRLGMGGGFYDFTFRNKDKNVKPLLVGLAYEFQCVEQLLSKETDVEVDAIITDKNSYFFRKDLHELLAVQV